MYRRHSNLNQFSEWGWCISDKENADLLAGKRFACSEDTFNKKSIFILFCYFFLVLLRKVTWP